MEIENFYLCEKSDTVNNKQVTTKPISKVFTEQLPITINFCIPLKLNFEQSELQKINHVEIELFNPDKSRFNLGVKLENIFTPTFVHTLKTFATIRQFGRHSVQLTFGDINHQIFFTVIQSPAGSPLAGKGEYWMG